MWMQSKRRLFALAIALLALAAAVLPASAAPEKAHDGILRLHVIANSDSREDQRVKLLVRDALLAVMEPGETVEEARAFVLANGKTLQAAAERTLLENGRDDPVQLMLGRYPFPDRDYGGVFYPAGEYEALRVVLGDGAGQNWWCVLFPPLCLIGTEERAEGAEGGLRLTSTVWNWLNARRTEHENIQ